jgi:hypothetical protein
MAIDSILRLGLAIDAREAIKTIGELEKRGVNLGIDKNFFRTFSEAEKKFSKSFSKGFSDALKNGLDVKHLKKMEKEFLKGRDQLRKADGKALDQQLGAVTEEFKRRTKGQERLAERRKQLLNDYNSLMEKSMEDRIEDWGSGIAGAFENLGSGPAGWANIGKQIAKGISLKGVGLQKGGHEKSGQLLGSLGKSMALMAGVAAGVAALVKILMDAEGQAKEMNKSFMAGQSMLDIMAISSEDLASGVGDADKQAKHMRATLAELRESVLNWDVLNKLGMKKDEALGVFGAFAEGGVVLKEIAADATTAEGRIENYTGALKAAKSVANAFGMDAGAMATDMAGYMEEWSMGLKTVQNEFSTVAGAAMDAGFGTKRFYGMLLEATSGASMFNMRMSEAAALLTKLSDVLSPKMAGEMLSSLSQGFEEEDLSERFKRIQNMGKGTAKKIYQGQAERNAKAYMDAFGKTLGEDGKEKYDPAKLQKQMASAGVNVQLTGDRKKDSQIMVEALQKIGAGDWQKLLVDISATDKDQARQLDKVWRTSQGATGNMDKMVMHMESWDAAAKLDALNEGVKGMMGGKTLADLEKAGNWVDMKAAMEQTGISPKQADAITAVMMRQAAQGERLEEIQKAALEQNGKLSEKDTKLLGELGLHVNAQTKMIENERGEVVNTLTAWKDEDSAALDAAMDEGKFPDKMMVLTEQIAGNTITMADRIEHGMSYYLEKIYVGITFVGELLRGVSDWFASKTGNLTSQQSQVKSEAIGLVEKGIKEVQEALVETSSELRQTDVELTQATSADDKAILEEKKKTLEATKKALQEEVDARQYGKTLIDTYGSRSFDDTPEQVAAGVAIRGQFVSPEKIRDAYGSDIGMASAGIQAKRARSKTLDELSGESMEGMTDAKKRGLLAKRMEARSDVISDLHATFGKAEGKEKEKIEEAIEKLNRDQKEDEKKSTQIFSEMLKKNSKTAEETALIRHSTEDSVVLLQKLPEALVEALQKEAMANALMGMGADYETAMSLASGIMGGDAGVGGAVREIAHGPKGLSATDLLGTYGSHAVGLTPFLKKAEPAAEDFLVRFGSKGAEIVTKFSKHDDLMVGGARVGGEIDAKTRGAGGATRGGGHVEVHINGGNQHEVFETVKRALKSTGVVPA